MPANVKKEVIKSLLSEQGHLCAYCMSRIDENEGKHKTTIEHCLPQAATSEKERLNYRNMVAVCGRNRDAHSNEDKSCDVKSIVVQLSKQNGYADAPWQIDSDEVIVLHVLAVHPDYRGEGLARRLVENVIEQERKAGKKALRLDVIENNTTAEKLYQKLGFRYIQAKTLYYDVVGEMTFKLYELAL